MVTDTIKIPEAVSVFRELIVQDLVQAALARKIPCAQIEMLADIAANTFAAALHYKRAALAPTQEG